jgi:hypothetical protein
MTLTIPRRLNGPPDSGNGGYAAGRVAETLLAALGVPAVGIDSPWVEVTLRSPPPLDTPYTCTVEGTSVVVTSAPDEALVAQARIVDAADRPVDAVPAVSVDIAAQSEEHYAGAAAHPFPTCWVCGLARPDGYHLRPGLVGDATREQPQTACRWVVTNDALEATGAEPTHAGEPLDAGAAAVPAASVWAALDCPGGWTALAGGRVAVLGRMTAQVSATPRVGDVCVVTGLLLGSQGRKAWTATSIYRSDGVEMARAAGTWITLPTG